MKNWPAGKWKLLLTGALSFTGGGLIFLYYEVRSIKSRIHPPMTVLDKEKHRAYVYIRPEQYHLFNKDWNEKGLKHITSEFHDYIIEHMPHSIVKLLPARVLSKSDISNHRYLSPWKLLQEASAENTSLDQDIIKKISNHQWQSISIQ